MNSMNSMDSMNSMNSMNSMDSLSVKLSNVIDTLGIKQQNFITELRTQTKHKGMDMPSFFGDKDILGLSVNDIEGDLIVQILYNVNPKFKFVKNRVLIIKEFRNKLAFDLSKFSYNSELSTNKSKIYDMLINGDLACIPSVFDDLFSTMVRYLADYFDINIIIYKCDYKMETLLDTSFYISKQGKRLGIDKTLPILEFIYNTKFYSIMDDGIGVRKWNERIENVFETEKMNLIDYKLLNKFKLSELSKLAETHDISLKKISDKTGKQIKRNKKELYNELFYLDVLV